MKEFANNINFFFSDFMKFTYLCKNFSISSNVSYDSSERNKFDSQRVYVIQNGEIKQNKTIKYFSVGYVDYLMNKMNLTKLVENKLIQCKNSYYK